MMTENRKSVLLYTDTWGVGGIEKFILDAMSSCCQKCDFTLFAVEKWNDGFDKELSRYAKAIHFVKEKGGLSLIQRHITGIRELNRFIEKNRFDVVHINTMNGTGYLYASVAKKRNIPHIIVHSHNSSYGSDNQLIKGVIHSLCKYFIGRGIDSLNLACSSAAGEYLFGSRGFEIVNIGIDFERFEFREPVRTSVRDELGVKSSTLVLGSVGRLSAQKNPIFTLEVFHAFRKMCPESKLLFVGDGDLREAIEARANSLNIRTDIIFIHSTSNPERYYSSMDVFLMPSAFEGLGITALEAQANGLPVFASTALSEEVGISNRFFRLDLKLGPAAWAQEIVKGGFCPVAARKADNRSFGTYSKSHFAAKMKEIYQCGA